jgi:hypothetical protein
MKYADCPTVTVTTDVAAPAAAVWALVSDIELSSRFSTEVSGTQWLDGAIGEWATGCIVTGFEPEQTFEWSVIGGDGDVLSIWRSTITGSGDGPVHFDYLFHMGPGRGGLNDAIEPLSDKEERIVERWLEEYRENTGRVVAGVKELAEGVTS